MTEPPAARPAGPASEKDEIVATLGEEWSVLADLLGRLSQEQWSLPVLPGWDVHDTVAHLVGTERRLAGAEQPPPPAAMGGHVRNDIGKANEAWVAALRSRPHAELLEDFRAVTAARLAALTAMPADDFHAPAWTPAGQATYSRFMRIRIFDCWMHEQDVRAAVGVPGNEAGRAAQESLDEVVRGLGYIVGKRGRAPDGSSVRIRLTGPIQRDLDVVVAGRAKVVASIAGEPTATLALTSSLFLRLAGGRQDPRAALPAIKLGGDADLARQIATSLAFTI